MSSALDLAKRLIACESVTPATGAVFDALEAMLEPRWEKRPTAAELAREFGGLAGRRCARSRL